MPKFLDWIAGRTAVTIADADELYVRDASIDDSKRITWSALKTALGYVPASGGTFTGNVLVDNKKLIVESDSASGLIEFQDASNVRRWDLLNYTLADDVRIRMWDAAGTGLVSQILMSEAGVIAITASGGVTVPDATADGQALAHSQAGALLSGLTLRTSDLAYSLAVRYLDTAYGLKVFAYSDGRIRLQQSGTGTAGADQSFMGTDNAGAVTFYKSVTVPDAAADGQALAHSQSGWSLAGGTFTGDLTTSGTQTTMARATTDSHVLQLTTGNGISTRGLLLLTNSSAGVDEKNWLFQADDTAGFGLIQMNDAMDTAVRVPFKIAADGTVNLTSATAVTVPDATADGQALAHSQAGARLQGLLVEATGTPVATYRSTGASCEMVVDAPAANTRLITFRRSNLARWAIVARSDADGKGLFVYRYNDAGVFQDAPLRFNEDAVSFQDAASVTVPAATAATHAAQVSALDATVGRLAIGGIEMGDTGWRNVSSLLSNGWTSTGDGMRIRRIGNVVHVVVDYVLGTAATAATFYTFPTGWKPSYNVHALGIEDPYGAGEVWGIVLSKGPGGALSALSSVLSYTTINRGEIAFSFATTDAWPASLPGTA